MGRESREIWVKRVERWRDSGLSAAEFAAEIGVNVASLRHWSWRLNAERRLPDDQQPAAGAAPLTWVEVAAPASVPAAPAAQSPQSDEKPDRLELVLGGGVIVRVPDRFEPEALRRLLSALDAR